MKPATLYPVWRVAILFCLLILKMSVQAQKMPASTQQIAVSVDTFNSRIPGEKIHLHFDKPYYAAGDTMWFKAYLLQASTHAFSPYSGIIYVDLINDSNKVVKRLSFPAAYGIGWGQIPLDAETVPEGGYTVYAYTTWLRNFGQDAFYRQHFMIGGSERQYWLVKASHETKTVNGKQDVQLALQLSDINNNPVKQQQVIVKVLADGKKVLSESVDQTNTDGVFKTTFAASEKSSYKNISILVQDKKDASKKVLFPVTKYTEEMDVQFMPEGGYMVAGIPTLIGFKAIGADGLGVDVQGKVIDSKNNTVSSIQSLHKGMGAFPLTPQQGESYTAVITSPGGYTESYPLPAVKNSGVVLHITDDQDKDSIRLKISVSPDMVNGKVYHLLCFSRGVVCYGANITLNKAETNGRFAKSLFPSGVAHATLFNELTQPVNERLFYVDRGDNLQLNIATSKSNYTTFDSIPIQVTSAKDNQPVVGSFSMAVTDDAQVKTDSAYTENIVSRMLLTSDLKGFIEAPAYYTTDKSKEAWKALDALLLTQGWVGYNWPVIFKTPAQPAFQPEPEFMIRGKVTNLLGKGVSKANVILMSTGKNGMFRNDISNADGIFTFAKFGAIDSTSFFVQARTARGNSFGLSVKIDVPAMPDIKNDRVIQQQPWFMNSDETLLQYVKTNTQKQEAELKGGDFHLLGEVTVRTKQAIRGSNNLNGPGGADQIIDENTIVNAGKKNMVQLLMEKVKGFQRFLRPDGEESYRINNIPTVIVVDGLMVQRFGSEKETLEFLNTEDVTGIEVMHSIRYSANYKATLLDAGEQMAMGRTAERTFIEITTRSGNGMFMKHSAGTDVYKPTPLSRPVAFYRPRYMPGSHSDKDLRSTIFWQPNLVTNKEGVANTSFFASGKETSYTIIIQGSDMNGNVGYSVKKITIGK